MANIFPKQINWLLVKVALCAGVAGVLVVAAITYYITPKYWRVGYQPTQPVPFSHEIHVTQVGMDCRYCHSHVEVSGHSNLPSTQTCMNCHQQIKAASPLIAPIKESWETGKPIQWVKIHASPDYAYFNHASHVNRGVSCASCHGDVSEMEVVWHHEPQSMAWCLECHTAPEHHLRPNSEVYNMKYTAEKQGQKQTDVGMQLAKEWNVHPPINCAGCHR
jgi:Cytochrome c7 and related cytochrome c